MAYIFQRIINLTFQIHSAFAQTGDRTLPSLLIINPVRGDGDINSILNALTSFLVTIGIPLAVLMYLWAGFQFLTSAGEDKKIKSAKQTLIWTTVGIVVLLIARGMVIVVTGLLTP